MSLILLAMPRHLSVVGGEREKHSDQRDRQIIVRITPDSRHAVISGAASLVLFTWSKNAAFITFGVEGVHPFTTASCCCHL